MVCVETATVMSLVLVPDAVVAAPDWSRVVVVNVVGGVGADKSPSVTTGVSVGVDAADWNTLNDSRGLG